MKRYFLNYSYAASFDTSKEGHSIKESYRCKSQMRNRVDSQDGNRDKNQEGKEALYE
jgi:hypothetical protein